MQSTDWTITFYALRSTLIDIILMIYQNEEKRFRSILKYKPQFYVKRRTLALANCT